MPESPTKFFLTTPIYYVNARPHIGHAYTTIVADVLARRSRAQGQDTWFLTGTDEHGQKIERSALAAGVPPQQFADQVSAEFENLWKRMGLTYDQYIRTTDPAHKRGVQKLFAGLYDLGHIYLSTYTGQYSIGEEMFVEGPPGTIGPDGRPTETVTEENFFFRLSNFQLPLIDLIESDTLKIRPESSKNEVLGFLKGNISGAPSLTGSLIAGQGGVSSEARPPSSTADLEPTGPNDIAPNLTHEPAPTDSAPARAPYAYSASGTPYVPGALRDLSVSRSSFTWGIPVPEPAASEATQKHVIYVWLDALANYMTAVGYGSDNPEDEAKFAKYWPADLHLVGKEITRFHCVYWPAFLLALNPLLKQALDEEAPLLSPEQHREWAEKWVPKAITANGWLLFDNSKMSKSKGNIVRTETILDAFGTLCPTPVSTPASEQAFGISSGLQPADQAQENEGASALGLPTPAPTGAPSVPDIIGKGGVSDEARPLSPESPTKHQRDLFATDVLRYYLLREIPFGQDGSFSFEALITRYNADLANGYGNLVSRTLNMIHGNFSGIIPNRPDHFLLLGDQNRQGTPDLIAPFSITVESYGDFLGTCDFAIAISAPLSRVAATDRYISDWAPWKLAKLDDPESRQKLSEVLYTTTEAIRIITALLYPILPYATASVWAQLGLGSIEQASKDGELKNLTWGGLKPGTKLGPLSPIFPRADKGLAQIMADMESQKDLANVTAQNDAATSNHTEFKQTSLASEIVQSPAFEASQEHHAPTDPAAAPRTASFTEPNPGQQVAGSTAHTTERPGIPPHTEAPASGIFAGAPSDASPQITIDDFAKVELRVAQILVCERIPKADKLLRLEVDLGYEKRQILSGIAEWYTPEELIGRRIVVITNLAPRKMRGLESHGMLLAASAEPSAEGEKPGKPHLATFTGADDLPLGSRLK